MNIHENARTTPRSRMLMIEHLETGWTVAAVAPAAGVHQSTSPEPHPMSPSKGEQSRPEASAVLVGGA